MSAIASRFSSPRFQRKLIWTAGAVLVAGITAVVVTQVWTSPKVAPPLPPPGKVQIPTQEKTVPIEAFFRKIVAVRERLRVLEQRINTHPKLTDEDRLQLQDYITRAYGSLTTFNVLFADAEDRFVGTKGSEDD